MTNLVFPDWPISNTVAPTFFLHSDNVLSEAPSHSTAALSYASDVPFRQEDADFGEVSFVCTFKTPCALVGSARALIYMSCEEATDMDVFVQIRKADSSGRVLRNINIPAEDRKICKMPDPVELINPVVYLGPTGCLRASHRALDQKLSNEWWPEHDYSSRQPITPGEIVELDIGLWQTGIYFEQGEKLILKISGHNMTLAEFTNLRGTMKNFNRGQHFVHVGGSYPSRLTIPTVPSISNV